MRSTPTAFVCLALTLTLGVCFHFELAIAILPLLSKNYQVSVMRFYRKPLIPHRIQYAIRRQLDAQLLYELIQAQELSNEQRVFLEPSFSMSLNAKLTRDREFSESENGIDICPEDCSELEVLEYDDYCKAVFGNNGIPPVYLVMINQLSKLQSPKNSTIELLSRFVDHSLLRYNGIIALKTIFINCPGKRSLVVSRLRNCRDPDNVAILFMRLARSDLPQRREIAQFLNAEDVKQITNSIKAFHKSNGHSTPYDVERFWTEIRDDIRVESLKDSR